MEDFNYLTQEQTVNSVSPSAFSSLMRSVYAWMAGGLAMTAVMALIVFQKTGFIYTIAANPGIMWGLIIAELALVLILSACLNRLSFFAAGLMFAGYAMLNGVTMAFIFAVYTMESIYTTFFITAGTFGAMSLVGYFIKKDLSAMGRILLMLLIGLIIATIVNFFVHSSGLAVLLNYAGVIIFVGLTAYDTQKIKKMLVQSSMEYGVTDQTSKIALMGSLLLYLDFINLFLYLLRIFGNRK